MPFQFPVKTPGISKSSLTVIDHTESNWGNGSHPFSRDYPHVRPKHYQNKDSIRRGDHLHALPYTVYSARVTTDTPIRIRASGTDKYGDWYDERVIHMSQWVPELIFDDPPRLAGEVANMRAGCITECLNKLATEKAGWGSNVLQAGQTAEMIAGTTTNVLLAWRAFRKGKWAEVRDRLGLSRRHMSKRSANRWLEYQYGWLPLLGDIHSTAQILRDIVEVESKVKSVQRSKTYLVDDHYQKDPGFADHWTGSVKYRVGLKVEVESTLLGAANSLGILNPLEIAWDVVPYSFIVDWFYPVGDTLGALSASAGLKLFTGYTSQKNDVQKSSVCINADAVADSRFRILDGGNLVKESVFFQRKPLYDFPLPQLYLEDNPLKSKRILNAIALTRGRFR